MRCVLQYKSKAQNRMWFLASAKHCQGASKPEKILCRFSLIVDFLFLWLILSVYNYFFKKNKILSTWYYIVDNLLQDLLFSYNIAVDRSDEVRRTLGKSASSVGLRLPEVYQPWWLVLLTSASMECASVPLQRVYNRIEA